MSTVLVQGFPLRDTVRLNLPGKTSFSVADFEEICSRNPELTAELSSRGELIIMTPTGGNSGWRNSELGAELTLWNRRHGGGLVFDSSTMFALPNGALRGPDVAWVPLKKWQALTEKERDGFPPLCPDFVIELRSPTDSIEKLQAKLEEYVANGATLGFLIDPIEKKAHVFRPGTPVQVLEHPGELAAEMPGLKLEWRRLWETGSQTPRPNLSLALPPLRRGLRRRNARRTQREIRERRR